MAALLPPAQTSLFSRCTTLLSVLLVGLSAGPIAGPQHVAAQPTSTASHDGCLHLPLIHSTNTRFFSKRAVETRAVEADLANRSDIAYYIELNLGTPPQPQFVQIDTGSFELWVNPDCTGVSNTDASFCRAVGHFDTSKSSTFSSTNTGTTLRYGIGSANITYAIDNVGISDGSGSNLALLKQIQFGVATTSVSEFSGIMGMGYGAGIATKYPNFIDQLASQNVTAVKAFSVALGSKQAEEGSVVFGGIDLGKFGGPLTRLPIIPAKESPDGVPRYWVQMDQVALTPPAGASARRTYSSSDVPVFLDSGSTMTLLPPDLTAAVAADFGAPSPGSSGFYTVDCALTSMSGTLDFTFAGGVTVKVPYDELIRTVGSPPTCFLGIQASSSFTLLGDTFMRSAYSVFDLETNSIWLAQAHDCDTSPLALTSVQMLASANGTCFSDSVARTVSSSSTPSSSPLSSPSSPSPVSSAPAGAGSTPAAVSTSTTPGGVSTAGGGLLTPTVKLSGATRQRIVVDGWIVMALGSSLAAILGSVLS